MTSDISAQKSHERFDKHKTRKRWVLLLILLPIPTFFTLPPILALYLVLLSGFFAGRLYLKRQRLVDRPLSTVQAASRGIVELQGHLTGKEETSPMTANPSTFWRLEFIAVEDNGNDYHRTLVATVFSKPYVEFADKTGSCWLRAEDVDWHLSSKETKTFRKVAQLSEFEPLLGHGFLDRWYEQNRHRVIKHASYWEVSETWVSPDSPLFAAGYIQRRRSDETGFDVRTNETVEPNPVNVELANEPMVHVHQSKNDTTILGLKRAWMGVLQQIEGGDPKQPLSGSQEVRVLSRVGDGKDALEVYSGNKSSELQLLKYRQYVWLIVMVLSLAYLVIYGPEQLPIALEQIEQFFASQ